MNNKKINKNKIISTSALIGSIILTYIIFKILKPERFGSLQSMLGVFKQCLIPAVGACGYFFAWIIGIYDMSLGANIIVSALVGCMFATKIGYVGLFIGCILSGLFIGIFNAFVTQKLRIPSAVATIGTLILYECFSYYITIVAGGTNMLTLPSELRAFGGYPWNIILGLVCFIIVYVLYKYSRLGVYCNAIGTDRKTTGDYGINVQKWTMIASAIGGMFIGITGLLSISYGSSYTPALNMSSFARGFTSMMGCFLGVAMKKYANPVVSIMLGEFLMYLLLNGLMCCGLDASLQHTVQGVVLVAVVCITMRASKYDEVA